MKYGDLVRLSSSKDDRFQGLLGFVMRVDLQYYGAGQAFKRYRTIERGKAFRSDMVDGVGPTKDGIRDRVLVLWNEDGFEYCESTELEVVSESR